MMKFSEFSDGCPKRNEGELSCGFYKHKCISSRCESFYVYRCIVKTLEKLKDHCHYHGYHGTVGFGGDKLVRKVTFEEEGS